MGLVGAGGIGVVLNNEMNLFQWPKVSMVLTTIVVVVLLIAYIVVQGRKRLM